MKDSLSASVKKFTNLILLFTPILRTNIPIKSVNIKTSPKSPSKDRLKRGDPKNIEIDRWKPKNKANF